MTTDVLPFGPGAQRWRCRRASYRPIGEPIEPHRYAVAPIPDDTTARRFVLAHHYSGSYPAARWRFGLYRRDELVGVAVLSVPMHPAALAHHFDTAPAVELGRFVLLDDVPANGETWFLARVFVALRALGLGGVLAYSDPIPRHTADGRTVMPGHVGTVYQAHNARFTGRGRPARLWVLADGRTVAPRALSKVRAGARGWLPVARALERAGAIPCPTSVADRARWIARTLPAIARPLDHPGTYRYAWPLSPAVARDLDRRMLRLPYPKRTARPHA